MERQLTLDLGRRPALGRAAFLVSASNARAVAMVEDWEHWPGGKLVLAGPEGAGKTHLAHVWAEMSGARITDARSVDESALEAGCLVIEDVDRIAGDRAREERVFHLHNAVINRRGRLLLTGRGAPGSWGIALPDLASRLGAAGVARLDPPDEALLAGVLVKLFADRQVRARPLLIDYLLRRIDRSFAAAEAAVAAIDAAALAQGRPVGPRLAAEVLQG